MLRHAAALERYARDLNRGDGMICARTSPKPGFASALLHFHHGLNINSAIVPAASDYMDWCKDEDSVHLLPILGLRYNMR